MHKVAMTLDVSDCKLVIEVNEVVVNYQKYRECFCFTWPTNYT